MPSHGITHADQVSDRIASERLMVLGGVFEDGATMLMIGPDEPAGFWEHFKTSSEFQDGTPNAMDRWSSRILGNFANEFSCEALFPFGGPPYHPFYTWALKTGRVHESPVKLLVHDAAGLWVSFRGVFRFGHEVTMPPAPASPCLSCADKPCLTACPGDFLTGTGYDVPGCKQYLSSEAGEPCMAGGCRVREICPASRQWARLSEQSAFHMKAFNPA